MNTESLENHFWALFFCHSPSPYLSLHIIHFVPRSAVQMQPYVATGSCCYTMAWNHSGELLSVPDLNRKWNKKQKFTLALPWTYLQSDVCQPSVCFLISTGVPLSKTMQRRWSVLETTSYSPKVVRTCVNFRAVPTKWKIWYWEGWIGSSRWFGALSSPPSDSLSPKLERSPHISGAHRWSWDACNWFRSYFTLSLLAFAWHFFHQNISVRMTLSFCSFMSMKLLKVFNLPLKKTPFLK